MKARRTDILLILKLRIGIKKVERLILGSLLRKGRAYPGDIIMDLRIAQDRGVKSIQDLTHKGYIQREEGTGFIRINPDLRKAVKIVSA